MIDACIITRNKLCICIGMHNRGCHGGRHRQNHFSHKVLRAGSPQEGPIQQNFTVLGRIPGTENLVLYHTPRHLPRPSPGLGTVPVPSVAGLCTPSQLSVSTMPCAAMPCLMMFCSPFDWSSSLHTLVGWSSSYLIDRRQRAGVCWLAQ